MRKRNLLQGSTKNEAAAFAKIKAHRMQMATGSISAHRVYADEFFDLTRERRIALLEAMTLILANTSSPLRKTKKEPKSSKRISKHFKAS